MQPPPSPPVYEFGDFELDMQRRVLVSRVDGQPVDITGRVLEALVFLVERAGQLVEKKALIEALWPHVVVEDGNLTQTIHTLRRVLGEKRGEHRYIATVAGRGYRFVAEVSVREARAPAVRELEARPTEARAPDVTTPAVVTPPRKSKRVLPWVAAGLAILLVVGVFSWRDGVRTAAKPAVVGQPSIAVLPFVDMSAEQDQVHFAEGLSEEILNSLAHADHLRVIARTSSFSFKDQNEVDIGTIAKRLAVSHVLEGSVRKSGDRLRITAQLIDGATSAHVWSDTYDRDIHDILGVQREIAAAVADALHVTLQREGPSRAETSSAEAYGHYLQGRLLFNRRSGTDLPQAKTHFEKAVEIDPNYGRAWAALAGVYFVARYEKVELPDLMQKWGEAAEHALALAPDLGETQIRAAQYKWNIGEPDAARVHLARALKLEPGDPLVMGMSVQDAISEGRLEDALELQRRVVALDPLAANHRGNLGVMLMVAGRLPEAQAEFERSLELSPTLSYVTENIADVLILQGRNDEALKVIARIPPDYRRDQRLAVVNFNRGALAESEAALARLTALAETGADPALPWAVAEVYAARNDADRAFQWLNAAHELAKNSPGVPPGWFLRERLQMAPYLKPLHADPRWQDLMTTLNK